ncbi:hypothetical protein [Ferruginibacter sp.]
MVLFKVLWTVDAIASLVVFYFFFVGITDGSVSSRNMGLWLMITSAITAIMLGSIWLKSHQHEGIAFALLCILALPVLFYTIYLLIAIFGNQRWN